MALAQLIPVQSSSMMEQAAARAAEAAAAQTNPVIQGLASHVNKRWESARTAKLTPEIRLLQCMRQRNGEYDPAKLAEIKKQSGSEIYMMLTSTKCRGASSWLRDSLLGTGSDKPWELDSTPIPDLPPEVQQMAMAAMQQAIQMYIQSQGQPPSEQQISDEMGSMKDKAMRYLKDEADERVDRMELKMEDQLIEGLFLEAFNEFIDDIVTFPTAIVKGPVPRKRKTLEWKGGGLVPVEKIVLEWERVDPFMCYPAAWASSPHDGPFIERHRLSRMDLEAMIGVDGFNSAAIETVLTNFNTHSNGWLSTSIDTQVATATDKLTSETDRNDDVIDALQLWDVVQGKMLVDWGMTAKDVPDPNKSYPCEVWLIGSTVIKAVLNYDPLGRKPYYTASYEKIPGAFWGNGVADLVRDCQAMCNSAARSLSNNMGISSGPQVGVNVSRLPTGENVTQMYPWKIWQFQNSDYQDASAPLTFFQPQSNANELMAVFDKFQTLADEYSGIPRYMTGETTPGAGRTASGLSMMISNASKSIKSVISTIDHKVLTPLLERLYQHNLRYSQDPDLIGDINIVAKGAMSMVAKESAAVRRNEFLQLVLNSPVAQQIVGPLGTAELLRENAKLLDINVDKVVPTREELMAQMAQQEQAMLVQQQAALQPETETIEFQTGPDGAVIGATKKVYVNPALGDQSGGGSHLNVPKPPVPKAAPVQADGTPQGGRQSSLMANRVSQNSH